MALGSWELRIAAVMATFWVSLAQQSLIEGFDDRVKPCSGERGM